VGDFLTSCEWISFSRRTLLYGVGWLVSYIITQELVKLIIVIIGEGMGGKMFG